MNTTQLERASKLINAAVSNPSLPQLRRHKSWLLVFADREEGLHFYDTKGSPHDCFSRIRNKQPDYLFVDIYPFTNPEEAEKTAYSLRGAYENITHLQNITKELRAVTPPTAPPGKPAGPSGPIPAEPSSQSTNKLSVLPPKDETAKP